MLWACSKDSTGCHDAAGPATRTKTMTQRNGNQEGTSRRFSRRNCHRAQTGASMTTEYQERFLHSRRLTAVVPASTQKDPQHPLKAPSSDVTEFKSHYVTTERIKNPPQPAVPSKCPWRCSSATHNPLRFVGNQMASKVEHFTSVYQNDFRTWKANKRQPCKLTDSLKVSQGLVVPIGASKGRSQKGSAQVAATSQAQVQEPQPFESITSYRFDYVGHPVQPRMRRQKPMYQPNTGLSEPAVTLNPTVTWNIHQDLVDKASEFVQNLKTCSLEAKIHGQVQTKESSLPTDHKFFSTTCQQARPVLPPIQIRDKSKKPFQATTTVEEEDYKAWNPPRHFLTVHKELDQPKKTTLSACISQMQ